MLHRVTAANSFSDPDQFTDLYIVERLGHADHTGSIVITDATPTIDGSRAEIATELWRGWVCAAGSITVLACSADGSWRVTGEIGGNDVKSARWSRTCRHLYTSTAPCVGWSSAPVDVGAMADCFDDDDTALSVEVVDDPIVASPSGV